MEPLHEFINDLAAFVEDRGYEISSSNDIDLQTKADGRLIGYWPSTVDSETFRELK